MQASRRSCLTDYWREATVKDRGSQGRGGRRRWAGGRGRRQVSRSLPRVRQRAGGTPFGRAAPLVLRSAVRRRLVVRGTVAMEPRHLQLRGFLGAVRVDEPEIPIGRLPGHLSDGSAEVMGTGPHELGGAGLSGENEGTGRRAVDEHVKVLKAERSGNGSMGGYPMS